MSNEATEAGIAYVGVDKHDGELELELTINEHKARVWLSREFWDEMTRKRNEEIGKKPMPKGVLEVGTTGQGQVIITHPDPEPDADGVGHIVFSVTEASHFIVTMQRKLLEAQNELAARGGG